MDHLGGTYIDCTCIRGVVFLKACHAPTLTKSALDNHFMILWTCPLGQDIHGSIGGNMQLGKEFVTFSVMTHWIGFISYNRIRAMCGTYVRVVKVA